MQRTLLVLLALAASYAGGALCTPHHPAPAAAQAPGECFPDVKQIRNSLEDLQRARVELEDQTKILRDIRAELQHRKR